MKYIAQFIIMFVLLVGFHTPIFAKSDLTIKRAQQVLLQLGYNPGPADGIWGKKTATAIKKFQQAKGFTTSGKLDGHTLVALGLHPPKKTDIRQLLPQQPAVKLRSKPKALNKADITELIRNKGFHHPDDYAAVGLSPTLIGTLVHNYESKILHGDTIIIDRATGLIWQKRLAAFVPGKEVQQFVKEMNTIHYAGLSQWRLPTIEELASLLASSDQEINFIDPIFDMPYWFCLSADTVTGEAAPSVWAVFFEDGYVMHRPANDDFDILLVHSGPE